MDRSKSLSTGTCLAMTLDLDWEVCIVGVLVHTGRIKEYDRCLDLT
jgi:hypothetical protein